MEIQLEKQERTELSHSQIVAPDRESVLTAVEIQPEKKGRSRDQISRAVATWVTGLLRTISVGRRTIRVGRTENDIVLIQRIGTADPGNVQQIAALQMELLAGYRQVALAQSHRMFFWALVGSGVGLIFLIASLGHAVPTEIAFLSGAIIEIVAGIVFVLYGRATAQLSSFHSRLEDLHRYLLANSLCEALDGDERNKARAALIQEITHPPAVQNPWWRPA